MKKCFILCPEIGFKISEEDLDFYRWIGNSQKTGDNIPEMQSLGRICIDLLQYFRLLLKNVEYAAFKNLDNTAVLFGNGIDRIIFFGKKIAFPKAVALKWKSMNEFLAVIVYCT